jgi:predicted amidohydrolase
MDLLAVQMDIRWLDPPENFRRVRRLLDEAGAIEPGSLVVLPEMFATGFCTEPDHAAEGPGGPAERFCREIARSLRSTVLAGLCVRDGCGPQAARNQAAAFSPEGEELCRFTKLHGFSPAGEPAVHAPGDAPRIFEWRGWAVAPLLCYDLRFPEAARAAVDRGAEMLVYPANWPAARADHWRTLAVARAIENQCLVVAVNRCGRDPAHEYAGGTLLAGPRGEILAEAATEQTVLRCRVDREDLLAWRREFPALADRRDDLGGSH